MNAKDAGEELEFFQALDDAFNGAMTSNNVDEIATFMTDDWCLVTPEVGPVSRSDFLSSVKTGLLSHDTMTKKTLIAKVHDDTAIVTGRGQNTGSFRGEPISADEWITDIYVRVEGKWRCTLTHLSPVLGR